LPFPPEWYKIKENKRSYFSLKGSIKMTRIPPEDRNMIEQAIYLPMVLTVLNRDIQSVNTSTIKLKEPYLHLIEETMKVVQKELSEIKRYMSKNKMKVYQSNQDEAFTMFTFLYKGYEEHHNYFNPRIRNKVQQLLEYYLFKQREQKKTEA
jgi:hypothetical protein